VEEKFLPQNGQGFNSVISFTIMLHPISFFCLFGIVPLIHSANQVTGDSTDSLELNTTTKFISDFQFFTDRAYLPSFGDNLAAANTSIIHIK
jgi:hypothetical protein